MEKLGNKLAVCGFDCTNCPLYKATINHDLDALKKIVRKDDDSISIENSGCLGCFSNNVNHMCDSCYMKKCSNDRGIDSCGKCNKYPCDYVTKYLSKASIENLNKISLEMSNKRCAIIGMSGNSLFYDVSKNNEKLVHQEVGGKGYNQAIACVRNGIKVSYLSAIGDDETGKMLEDYMKNEGVDTFFVRKNKPSLEAKIFVDEAGNNKVCYDQNNVATLDVSDVLGFEEEIKKSDCLLLQFEYSKEVIKKAIELAKKHKKMVVINPAPMIFPDINLVKDADFLTPNEDEAITLFNKNRNNSFDNVIDEEMKSGIKCILNTVGKEGIVEIMDGETHKYPSIKVNAIDTTGAGDTFNGIFVSTLLRGASIDYAIKRAIIGSGLEVTKKYVMDAIPSSVDIEKYIENNKL